MKDQIAIVTGGGSGIGQAVSEALAGEGCRVVVADLNVAAGTAVANQIGGLFVEADLSTRAGCQHVVKETEARLGAATILVNNAGFQNVDRIQDFPEDTWDKMIALMLTAPFLLSKYVWPGMVAAGNGRIVNISSIHGLVASPAKSAYISAKHGLIGLTKTLALEGGEHGITVNAICPAYVRTPLVENQIAAQARDRGIPAEQVVQQVMLEPAAIKQMIEPQEIADMVLYLCSDKARSVTGASLAIDLGWTAR